MPPVAVLAVVALYFVICVIGYALGRYSYEILGDALRMRLRLLRVIPWGRRTVRFSDIEKIKILSFREDWRYGWLLFGNVLTKKSVIVRLRKRWLGVLRYGIVITPPNPDAFVAEVNRQVEESAR